MRQLNSAFPFVLFGLSLFMYLFIFISYISCQFTGSSIFVLHLIGASHVCVVFVFVGVCVCR